MSLKIRDEGIVQESSSKKVDRGTCLKTSWEYKTSIRSRENTAGEFCRSWFEEKFLLLSSRRGKHKCLSRLGNVVAANTDVK